jgi:non-specific serine/threonine protein kinase
MAGRERRLESTVTHNLPLALTSFVGRSGELERLEELVARHRHVTVTGPGGSGKTRLAVELARRLVGRFEHGTWLVELAQVTAADLVPGTAAAALGVVEHPGRSMTEAVADAVAGRHLLLLLDNCEHLVEAAADLTRALLTSSADLRVLATSREPLRVEGEARYPLGPLAVPEEGVEDDPLGDFDAVALFVERAQRVDPGFCLEGAQDTVVDIVRHLDGMPLAIELAAARVAGLGVAEVRDQMRDRFGLLVGGPRGAPARQQSLHATILWSYAALRTDEERAFRLVSVFPAPFTLAAAEAVAGPGVADVVAALVERSLLVAPRTGVDGRSRFGMLETLRAFAADRLDDKGQRPAAMRAALTWALPAAEGAAASFATPDEAQAARWFDAEHDNLVALVEWALGQEPELALRLAVALGPWWEQRGKFSEGWALLGVALTEDASPALAAPAHRWLGALAAGMGDLPAALPQCAAACELAADDSVLLVDSLVSRSYVCRNLGQLDQADLDTQRAVETARAIDYPSGESLALTSRGKTAYYRGDHATAMALALEARRIGDGRLSAVAQSDRNRLLTIALYKESGDLEGGLRTAAEGLEFARRAGLRNEEAFFLGVRAEWLVGAGRFTEAEALVGSALQLCAEVGNVVMQLDCLRLFAMVCASTGRPEQAAVLFTADAHIARSISLAGPTIIGDWDLDARRAKERVAAELDEGSSRAAELRGGSLRLPQAVELAYSWIREPATSSPELSPASGRLSAREQEVVSLVAEGLTDAQIAEKLFLSIRTVRSHLDRIRDKTGYRRRADLTRLALEAGLA